MKFSIAVCEDLLAAELTVLGKVRSYVYVFFYVMVIIASTSIQMNLLVSFVDIRF